MAATNVQAFSGDVEISSNLAVNTNDLFVDTVSGNVGIGTTNPATPFNINKLTATIDPKAHTTTEFIRLRGDKVIGETYAISGGIKLGGDTGGTATADGRIEFYANDGADVGNSYGDIPDKFIMCMRGDGRVGIGTTEPESPLEVHGPDLTGEPEGTASLISRHISDEDGVLNIFGIVNTNGGETIGLQTQIDGRLFATDIAGGWATGQESRYRLCLQPYKGRVGIGKTVPLDNLHVSGQISTQNGNGLTPAVLFRSGENNTNSWAMKTNISDSYAGDFTIDRLDASTPTKFVIRNNGRVGIGTATPDSQLSVFSSGAADNVGVQIGNGDRKWRVGIRGDTSDQFAIQDDTAGAMRLQIDSSGQVGINCSPSTLLEVKKSSDGPAVRLGSTDGMLEIGTIVTTYGNETVTMQSYIDQGNSGTFSGSDRNLLALQPYVGRVGIGITNPGHTLDVNGSVGIRGYTYSRLFYSFYHQTGVLNSAQNYDVTGGQFTAASGSGVVDDGWYHAVAMRFDSNPFEKSTYQVWFYGSFGDYGNALNAGLALQMSGGNLRMVTDFDAANYPSPYMIHLHKYGGRDW
jgi:hypothetical protein